MTIKELIRSKIRNISDWPKKGIVFRDITPLLEDKNIFKAIIDWFSFPYFNKIKIDKVIGIDARGFIFASALAYNLNSGLSIIRKKGKLPPKTVFQEYLLEYGSNIIEAGVNSILPGEKVLLVDDVLATGGTMKAAVDLVNKLKGKIIGIDFLIELDYLKGREKLQAYNVRSFINYSE